MPCRLASPLMFGLSWLSSTEEGYVRADARNHYGSALWFYSVSNRSEIHHFAGIDWAAAGGISTWSINCWCEMGFLVLRLLWLVPVFQLVGGGPQIASLMEYAVPTGHLPYGTTVSIAQNPLGPKKTS